MNKIKYITLGLLLSSAVTATAQKQEEQTQPVRNEVKTQPLELPNVIIEGREQLNVQAGVKQFPDRPKKISEAEIDSINPPQKLQALLLPIKTMPTELINKSYKKGYLKANVGNYLTTDLLVGYETSSREYTFFGKGYFDYSDGHVKNSDYSRGGVDLNLFYIAPKKFWIFGGSKTTGNVSFDMNSYNMYGMDSAVARKAMTLNLSVLSEGEYAGYDFYTGAGFRSFGLDHGNIDGSDNRFNAFLKLKTTFDNFEVNALADLNFGSVSKNSTNLINLGAGMKFLADQMTFDLNAAFQSAGSTAEVQRANLKVDAGIDYRINQDFTFKAKLLTGFDNQQLYELWQYNKYLTNTPTIDFSYDKNVSACLQYHPNQVIMASAGLKIGATDRFKYFAPDSLNIFNVKYADAQQFAVFAKGSINLSENDAIYAEVMFENRTFNDTTSNKIPFIPSFTGEISYDRKWTEKFGTNIELAFVGSRYADFDNKKELDSFLNLSLGLDYKLQDNLKLFAKFENLLNSDIYIWEKYKEREIYIAAGLLWQF